MALISGFIWCLRVGASGFAAVAEFRSSDLHGNQVQC